MKEDNKKNSNTKKSKSLSVGGKIILFSAIACIVGGLGIGSYFLVKHFTSKTSQGTNEKDGQLAYQEVDGGYKVTGLTNENKSKITNIVVPNTYKNKSVIGISKGAFKGCSNLNTITLPFIGGSDTNGNSNSDDSFFGYVFGDEMYDGAGAYTYQCRDVEGELDYHKFAIPYNLRNVKITGGSYVPAGAFSYCKYLESIEINNNATSIGNYAFNNCLTLYSFSIMDKITSIEKNAFEMCLTLQNIAISSSTVSIGENAFTNCISAMSVKIPISVTTIGKNAFHNVNNGLFLVEAKGSEVEGKGWDREWKDDQANVVYEYKNGGIFYKENFHLALCGEGNDKYLYIIQWIGDWGQATVIIPDYMTVDGVKYRIQVLGARVFEENDFVQTVRMGKNIKLIGASCFEKCSLLNTIDLANVDYIGKAAFKNCPNLRYHFNESGLKEEGIICTNVQVIGNEAFYGCENVRFYRFSHELNAIGDSAFENNLRLRGEWGKTPKEYDAYITTIPYTVTSLGKSAFKNSFKVDDTSSSETYPYIYFEQGENKTTERINISSIPESLFEDCGYSGSKTGIYTHTVRIDFWLGNSPYVKKVEDKAFKNCYARRFQGSSECINISEMGDEAFYKTNFLIESEEARYAQVSPFVTKLGDRCYYGNTQLPGISFSAGEYKSKLEYIGEDCFAACSNAEFTSITIPKTVKFIGKGAFRSMSYLEEADFENENTELKTIPVNCFTSCTALKKVNILDSIEEICSSAFSSCQLLTDVSLSSSNSLKIIGSSAFASCANLQGIPNLDLTKLTSFGSSVFSACSNFNYNGKIGFDGTKTNISSSAFQDCLSLTSATLGENITAIDSSAFSGCTALTKLNGSNKNLSISSNAFYNCEKLTLDTNLTFKSVGDAAFYGCSNITSINLDNSMSALNANAFAGCTGISSLTLPTKISSASTTPFSGWTSSQKIKFVQANIKTGTIGDSELITRWGWKLERESGSGQDSVYICSSDGSNGTKWVVNK